MHRTLTTTGVINRRATPPVDAAMESVAAVPLPRAARLIATLALMLASGMQAADATIANVALPQLDRDLGGGLELAAWVMTGYLCAAAIVAPLTGALRRRFGLRTLFAAAVGVFTVASLLCALAPSPAAIVLFRVLQGAGGGVVHPLAQAILLDLYPRERHARMMGLWGATIMIGPIAGPAIGGFITDLASWRWVFGINIPLGALAIAGMSHALRENNPDRHASIDVLGVLLMAAGIGALQLCLDHSARGTALVSPAFLAEAAIAAVAAAAVAARMRSGAFTLFRPGVFRDRNFAAAALYNFTASALIFVGVVLVPVLVQGPIGDDARTAGLTIVPRGIAMMLSMLLAGQLVGKVAFRIVLIVGLGCMAAGLFLLSGVSLQQPLPLVVFGSIVQSIGGGILFTSLSTIAFSTLPPDRRTDATGVYSLLRQLGYGSGVALMTAVLRAKIAANLTGLAHASTQVRNLATLHAYSDCFRAMAVASVVAIAGVWLFRPPDRSHP